MRIMESDVLTQEIEERIIKAISRGPKKFFEIHHHVGFNVNFRHVDRRLQVLRKSGKIKFEHGKGWTLNV